MIKIGLVGEDPNDTKSIVNLLEKKFQKGFSFITLLKRIRGSQLDTIKTFKSLKLEYEEENPSIVVFIRDADAIITESSKIEAKRKWFSKLLPAVNNKGILLLNIYELEALILADIDSFNKLYNVDIRFQKNVEFQKDPKGLLKDKTYKHHRYEESDAPSIFKVLDFDTVLKNCSYFNSFFKELQYKFKV